MKVSGLGEFADPFTELLCLKVQNNEFNTGTLLIILKCDTIIIERKYVVC